MCIRDSSYNVRTSDGKTLIRGRGLIRKHSYDNCSEDSTASNNTDPIDSVCVRPANNATYIPNEDQKKMPRRSPIFQQESACRTYSSTNNGGWRESGRRSQPRQLVWGGNPLLNNQISLGNNSPGIHGHHMASLVIQTQIFNHQRRQERYSATNPQEERCRGANWGQRRCRVFTVQERHQTNN